MTASPRFDRLACARRTLAIEAGALEAVATRLGEGFEQVADMLFHCRGRVAVAGVGKSADVGQKLVGTFNSTGTRSYTLDPTRAVHGDLGAVHAGRCRASSLAQWRIRGTAPPSRPAQGTRGRSGRDYWQRQRHARSRRRRGDRLRPGYRGVPALARAEHQHDGDDRARRRPGIRAARTGHFSAEQFAKYHPAGSLGRKLATVAEHMRHGIELRIASAADSVREVFARVRHTGRRTGAIMIVDNEGRLAGLFTDSDLARLFESRRDAALDSPIAMVMTSNPVVIGPEARLGEAIDLLKTRKFSELPVVDSDGKPIGMLDITDLIGLDPAPEAVESRPVLRLTDRKSA